MTDSVWSAATVRILEARGLPVDDLLSAAALDRSELDNREGRVPLANTFVFQELAAKLANDDCFGLHLGETAHPAQAGALAYVCLNSPTVGAALDNLCRYVRVHRDATNVRLCLNGEMASLSCQYDGSRPDACRQAVEASLVLVVRAIRIITGPDWMPIRVGFRHRAPEDADEHRRIFGAPVDFGQDENGIVFHRELLDRPNPAADKRVYTVIVEYVDRIVTAMRSRDGDLEHDVRQAIAKNLRNGDPRVSAVAVTLEMSTRTLQRRLKERGIVFSRIVDEVRETLAREHLSESRLSIAEIAYFLGYSDISAFSRAYRRWTGRPPGEDRKA